MIYIYRKIYVFLYIYPPMHLRLLPSLLPIVPKHFVNSLPFRLHPFSYLYFMSASLRQAIYLHLLLSFYISTYSICTHLTAYLSISSRYRPPPPPPSHFSATVRRSECFVASGLTTLPLKSYLVAASARGVPSSAHCGILGICKIFFLSFSLYSPSLCTWIRTFIFLSLRCLNFFVL